MSDNKTQYPVNPRIENQFVLVGNMGGEVHTRESQEPGKTFLSFSLAINPSYLDKTTNKYVKGEVQWYSVMVFNKYVKAYVNAMQANARVRVIGRLSPQVIEQIDDYTGEVSKEFKLNLIADKIELAPLPKKEVTTSTIQPQTHSEQQPSVMA